MIITDAHGNTAIEIALNNNSDITVDANLIKINTKLVDGSEATITIPTNEAEMLRTAIDRFWYKQDVIRYFTECNIRYFTECNIQYDTTRLFNNDELIENIIDEYADNRSNADGGEYEDTMHWSECLENAVETYSEELAAYRIDTKC